MRVHIGCGGLLFNSWVNIDPQDLSEAAAPHDITVLQADASHLPLEARTVETLFSNAVFEHIYLAHQLAVLREWERVISDTGRIIAIGIPDFERVAMMYLAGDQGVTGPVFDLFEAHRYALGFPEGHLENYDWADWQVADHVHDAPPTWLVQVHKCIFDARSLNALLGYTGLEFQVFRYGYRQERQLLNLGFIAGHDMPSLDELDFAEAREYINFDTLRPARPSGPSRLAACAYHYDKGTSWDS